MTDTNDEDHLQTTSGHQQKVIRNTLGRNNKDKRGMDTCSQWYTLGRSLHIPLHFSHNTHMIYDNDQDHSRRIGDPQQKIIRTPYEGTTLWALSTSPSLSHTLHTIHTWSTRKMETNTSSWYKKLRLLLAAFEVYAIHLIETADQVGEHPHVSVFASSCSDLFVKNILVRRAKTGRRAHPVDRHLDRENGSPREEDFDVVLNLIYRL